MFLEYQGLVRNGDSSRCGGGLNDLDGSIWIGDHDLVNEVDDTDFSSCVVVKVDGIEVFRGDVVTKLGYGYSEYTPLGDDELKIGGADLLELLGSYAGKEIRLVIEDAISTS